MAIISATITSAALCLCVAVGVRIAPVAWRGMRFHPRTRERDTLMLSWGLMWAAVVPLLALRSYRLFVDDHDLLQSSLVVDLLMLLIVASAVLMLVVDASIRRRDGDDD
jgi:hypothetical protein